MTKQSGEDVGSGAEVLRRRFWSVSDSMRVHWSATEFANLVKPSLKGIVFSLGVCASSAYFQAWVAGD